MLIANINCHLLAGRNCFVFKYTVFQATFIIYYDLLIMLINHVNLIIKKELVYLLISWMFKVI